MMLAGVVPAKLPCTASHEGAGTIVATGSEVNALSIGDRIMCGLSRNPCGTCADCQGPESCTQYCSDSMGAVGLTLDGAFAEYLICDARKTVKLPDSLSFETAAPLACAGITVWRGVVLADLKPGQWIAIVGSGGGLGHLGIKFAKALGLRVVGIDARDEALGLSRECGADIVLDARKGNDDVVKEVQAVTNGVGVDATVNTSDANSAAATACAVTKKHGSMVQLAQPDTVAIPFRELIFRDIRVRGSLIGSPEDTKRMMQTVTDHNITVKTNQFYGLEKIPELVELAHGGKMQGKGVIVVDEEQLKNRN